jgi:toxin-antitoxin system PIN domain toxin
MSSGAATHKKNIQLADVNVLLALLWPRHIHHAEAHAWFAGQGHKGWATNSITQVGVLRLLTNPAVTGDAVNAATAVRTLEEAIGHPHHQFWPLDYSVTSSLRPAVQRIAGYRQWTDALLFRQACDCQGKLVTFDAGMAGLADSGSRGHLLILS